MSSMMRTPSDASSTYADLPSYHPFRSQHALESAIRRHPASLIPKFEHDPALVELMRAPVSREMICKCCLALFLFRESDTDCL